MIEKGLYSIADIGYIRHIEKRQGAKPTMFKLCKGSELSEAEKTQILAVNTMPRFIPDKRIGFENQDWMLLVFDGRIRGYAAYSNMENGFRITMLAVSANDRSKSVIFLRQVLKEMKKISDIWQCAARADTSMPLLKYLFRKSVIRMEIEPDSGFTVEDFNDDIDAESDDGYYEEVHFRFI